MTRETKGHDPARLPLCCRSRPELRQPCASHPHVFVDARTGFHFDAQGRLTALRITWTYDAFTSLKLFDILDLDKDNDGLLDDADRAAIVAGETEWQ